MAAVRLWDWLLLDGTDAVIATSLAFLQIHKKALFAVSGVEAIQAVLLAAGHHTTLPAHLLRAGEAVYVCVGGPRRLAAMREDFTAVVTANNERNTRQQAAANVTRWWAQPAQTESRKQDQNSPDNVDGSTVTLTASVRNSRSSSVDSPGTLGIESDNGSFKGKPPSLRAGRIGRACSSEDLAVLADAYASHSLFGAGSSGMLPTSDPQSQPLNPASAAAALGVGAALDPFEERTLDFPGFVVLFQEAASTLQLGGMGNRMAQGAFPTEAMQQLFYALDDDRSVIDSPC
eukprot:SAG31_NODE_6431_length_2024_cov_1.064416_1_plen_289_part_00